MKAIEIKSELKIPFLEACRLTKLEVIQLPKILITGRIYFRVVTVNYAQDDIFKLGVYFAQLTLSVPIGKINYSF